MAAGSDDGSLASHTQLSDEAFFQLFQMVEDSPCLWKTDHEGYKSIRKKDRTWGELCERLQRRYANLGNLNSGTYAFSKVGRIRGSNHALRVRARATSNVLCEILTKVYSSNARNTYWALNER